MLGEIDGAIATWAKLLLKKVVVLDIALPGLNEPGFVHFHD